MKTSLQINNPLFTADSLSVGYESNLLITDISFELFAGDLVLLCGPNGIGKSTLLKTVAGLIKPISGQCGTVSPDVRVSFVPSRIPKVAGFTVSEFVALSCHQDSDWLGRLPDKFYERINEALDTLGIGHLADRDIDSLSDGEFQKSCIAVAVVREADIVLLDEPTAFLDVDSRAEVMQGLSSLSDAGMAVMFSSHDIHDAVRYADRVMGLKKENGAVRFTDSGRGASKESILSVVSSCFNVIANIL